MSFVNYSMFSPAINNVDVTRADTVPEFPLGCEVEDKQGSQFKYVKAGATLVAGQIYVIPTTNILASGLTTTLAGSPPVLMGIPQVALTSGQYGWVFVGPGFSDISVLVNCAQDVPLYTTATAGSLDDTATTKIPGAKIITTITTAAITPGFFASRLVVS